MKVLVIGATGFIGSHVSRALRAAGHLVVSAARNVAHAQAPALEVNLAHDLDVGKWLPRLTGIDAVVNAAGIFHEEIGQTFDALLDAGPRALFAACERAGVQRVVQISALGADDDAQSRFHLSRRSADRDLASRPLDWAIVYPSLVFGRGGRSAQLFATLAAMPLTPLPGNGGQTVQPVHIDDLALLVVRLVEQPGKRRVAAVGARAVTISEWLSVLRSQIGRGSARFFRVPLGLTALVAGRENLGMLLRGNAADALPLSQILGRMPRGIEQFLNADEAGTLSLRAPLGWLLPLLRAAVAIVWIVSGIVSLGLYPVADSLAMLARVGLSGPAAALALYGAALLDIAFGVLIFLLRDRTWLWRAQIAVVMGYSAIIAFALPELWLHPFGPLVKNFPMLAAMVLLHELEPAWRQSA